VSIRVKAQKNYYLTEVTLELPTDPGEANDLLKSLKTDGKMVVVYSGGGVGGINIEQKQRIPEHIDAKIRELLGLGTKIA
jgi:hypothetical protein